MLKIKTPKRPNTSDMTKNLTSLTGWQAKLYRQAKLYFYVAVTCTIILFIVKFNTLRQLGELPKLVGVGGIETFK